MTVPCVFRYASGAVGSWNDSDNTFGMGNHHLVEGRSLLKKDTFDQKVCSSDFHCYQIPI